MTFDVYTYTLLALKRLFLSEKKHLQIIFQLRWGRGFKFWISQTANGLTHKLCKTDMINMNDIQLLNNSESFAPDSWCHVECKIIL